MVRSPSILERNSFTLSPSLSPTQAQVDSLVTRFVEEASSPTTLVALMAGGMAYRLGRIAVMGSGGGQVLNLPLRHTLSVAFGLGAEVAGFEFTNRTLQSVRAHGRAPLEGNPNLWSWSGPGGWAQGLSSSLVTFGLLRGAGVLAREQNLIFQHAFQSTAMVAGHQGSAWLGITPRPEGTLAEQFLQAEATNLQLGAGTALLHAVAPGVHAMERNLDLVSRGEGNPWPSPRPRQNTWPSFALAMVGERGSISPPKASPRDPVRISISPMSMIGEGGEGSGHPPPQGGLRESLARIWEHGPENAATEIQKVAEHLATDPERLSGWLSEFRRIARNAGQEEALGQSLKTVEEILERSRDQPNLIPQLFHFFSYTANDFQAPQRELQTFSDLVEIGQGAIRLYERLGVSMHAALPHPFGREVLGGGYSVEISPGEGEAAGGLHVTLLRPEGDLLFQGGTPLAEIGILVGQSKVQVVFVQGERGHYSAHVNRLRPLLGQDPFDWLIQGVSQWATAEGFKSLEAYSHTHNYWLRNRLAQLGEGLEGQAYRVHLSRLYEGRFLRLGLRSSAERPHLFMKPLEVNQGGETSAVSNLLRRILHPGESVQTIPDPVLSHVHRLLISNSPAPQSLFDPSTFVTGRNTLVASLTQPELKSLIMEHLLNLEETYPPSALSDYIFAMGYHTARGRSPAETVEILSARLNEGSETQSFYRGLSRIELLVWRLGAEVVSRKSNQEKFPQVEGILTELKRQRGYEDLENRVEGVFERLKKEDPASIRVSNDTLREVIDLFQERSMQHMFFSRHPSEAAGQFADMGGVMMRLDLPARLITAMKPIGAQHVAFPKSPQNLALLIHHFKPQYVYQGPAERLRALEEAPPLSSTGLLFHRPAAELPLFIPPSIVSLVETAYQYPPARHLRNQMWIGKTVKAIVQDFREGRGDFFESQSISLGRDPESAFEFLKGFK